jgi:hypothetical protein
LEIAQISRFGRIAEILLAALNGRRIRTNGHSPSGKNLPLIVKLENNNFYQFLILV